MQQIEVDIDQRRFIDGVETFFGIDTTQRLVYGDVVEMVDLYGESLGAARVTRRRDFNGRIGGVLYRFLHLTPDTERSTIEP